MNYEPNQMELSWVKLILISKDTLLLKYISYSTFYFWTNIYFPVSWLANWPNVYYSNVKKSLYTIFQFSLFEFCFEQVFLNC